MCEQQMGWDIGGAHIKAVLLNSEGVIVNATQLACPLWLGIDKLELAVLEMLSKVHLSLSQISHAVTMTGELADVFANRHDGVIQISKLMTKLLGSEVLFYRIHSNADADTFIKFNQVPESTTVIASANWHASATLLAQYYSSALLVDIGSTTTDIIQIEGGKVINIAMTDAMRMQRDMLVYTGVVRTPLMALTQKLVLDGQETNVAAEYFATMADVYRLTEELPDGVDMADTADGAPKTIIASARRLARMIGCDVEDKPLATWQAVARTCRDKQLNQIKSAIVKHLEKDTVIVGTGAGAFLVEVLSEMLHHPYERFSSIMNKEAGQDLDTCLPAYAVAKLAFLRAVSS
jgi:(4-(4-[2-(gamma-L-glutamylamino)ethyl]phenoxymethyl)furan-2-yl)methanamine synthase